MSASRRKVCQFHTGCANYEVTVMTVRIRTGFQLVNNTGIIVCVATLAHTNIRLNLAVASFVFVFCIFNKIHKNSAQNNFSYGHSCATPPRPSPPLPAAAAAQRNWFLKIFHISIFRLPTGPVLRPNCCPLGDCVGGFHLRASYGRTL